MQNNIFLDANFNNFVSIQQQKGGGDNLIASMQVVHATSAQPSGTQSFRIPSQEKSFQSNAERVSSSGVVIRPHNHVKQVYLPFIQTPKQHHVGGSHPPKGLMITGKQQHSEEVPSGTANTMSIFKDIQSQKMSIAHHNGGGQMMPPATSGAGGQAATGMYVP